MTIDFGAPAIQEGSKIFRCPIAGCDKVYRNARGGWDAHVGSVTNSNRRICNSGLAPGMSAPQTSLATLMYMYPLGAPTTAPAVALPVPTEAANTES